MIIATTSAELRDALGPRRDGTIGFVPTMGALHAGHLTLVDTARAADDTVVLSIFVNPTQFDEASDLARYPRPQEEDLRLAEAAGVDVVYLPGVEEMYPAGYATTVSVTGTIAETLEGAARGRAHFDGVATVVAKLLLAVLPDRAYFGAKDAQQVLVVRRMVADLGVPTEIRVVPTSRDADGLARSSRNARLSHEERQRALAVPRALLAAADAVWAGERDAAGIAGVARRVLDEEELAVEYVEVVDPASLEPLGVAEASALLLIAVRVGDTRLIDNRLLHLDSTEDTTSSRRDR